MWIIVPGNFWKILLEDSGSCSLGRWGEWSPGSLGEFHPGIGWTVSRTILFKKDSFWTSFKVSPPGNVWKVVSQSLGTIFPDSLGKCLPGEFWTVSPQDVSFR